MFLQHRKGGRSHLAADSPVTHRMHVYGGYLLLSCWLLQIGGGLAKWGRYPKKSVPWHGVLAQGILSLTFLWVLVFASFAGLTLGDLVAPESGFTRVGLAVPLAFVLLFVFLYAMVLLTLNGGVRVGQSKEVESKEVESESRSGVGESETGSRSGEDRLLIATPG